MSEFFDDEKIVAVVRHNNRIRWFRSERETWILDWHKWRDDFVKAGYQVAPLDTTSRFGLAVIDEKNCEEFLHNAAAFAVSKEQLQAELVKRYPKAESWWDASDLFPIVFVDFDNKKLGAFYFDGPKMERYAPDGWISEFTDFANTYSNDVFPDEDKFWFVDGLDLLRVLNDRGSNASQ